MRLLAPAKINLHLRVGPLSASGFHPVLTWMTTVALFDTLTIERLDNRGADEPRVRFTCDDATLPVDSGNLAVRAAEIWVTPRGPGVRSDAGIRLHLEKRVPHGAGLGGGSSD